MKFIFNLILILFLGGLVYGQADSSALKKKAAGIAELSSSLTAGKGVRIRDIDFSKPIELPVAEYAQVGGTFWAFGLDSINLKNDYAAVSAFAYVHIEGLTQVKNALCFGVSNLALSPQGLKPGQDIKLSLLNSPPINLGKKCKMVFDNSGQNFVTFDCDGFKSLQLSGYFEFDSSMIKPADNAPHVRAAFKINASNLNDILIQTSISPFEIKGLQGFKFSVANASLDLSDTKNPDGFAFPLDYPDVYAGNPTLWRGFSMKQAKVTLPNSFTKKDGRPIEIEVNNLLIDKLGVSGNFAANNVLDSTGRISSWNFSIDKLHVTIVKNELKGGGMEGGIKVPPLSKPLKYAAVFKIVNDELDIDAMAMVNDTVGFANTSFIKCKLKPGTRIAFKKKGADYTAEAFINAELNFDAKLKAGFKCENFHISSEEPYILGGTFGANLSLPQGAFGGFPLVIRNLGANLNTQTRVLGLTFDGGIHLGKAGATEISAGVRLHALFGPSLNADGGQVWEFKRFKVDSIGLDLKISCMHLVGGVAFFEGDPVLGDGFKGNAVLTLKKFLEGTTIGVTAQFGKVSGFRYWYFDAMVQLPNPVPFIPPVIEVDKFMGGAYMKMKPDFAAMQASINAGNPIDFSNPTRYTPDNSVAFGFKLGLGFIVKNKKLGEGCMALEMNFNSSGGVNNIALFGSINLLETKKDDAVMANGSLLAVYDAPTQTFHAEVTAFFKTPIMQGIGPNSRLGRMVMHVDPQKWYMWVGRPAEPLGMKLSLAGLDLLTIQSYLQFGKQIDDFPAPPAALMEMLGNNPDVIMRNPAMTENGLGFVFGARAEMGFSGEFAIFYAAIQAGLGFDVMLRDYGPDARCAGSEASSRVGINGWYASGQAFAYLRAAIGIKVSGKRIPIIRVGAGALLQAKLPNPFWFKGIVVGEYSILCGLVSGTCRFEFELGEKCNLVNASELTSLPIIADMKPSGQSTNVDVFSMAQASFNMAIDKSFTLTEDDGAARTFRVKLVEYKLKKSDGSAIPGAVSFNPEKTVLTFTSTDILPGRTALTSSVKIQWEELKNGAWALVRDKNNQPDIQDSTITFTTGDAPDHIVHSNVVAAYPLHKQYNFYKDESNIGFIQLQRGQPDLFLQNSENPWKFEGFLTTPNEAPVSLSYAYDAGSRRVSYQIPTSSLKNDKVYTFELKKVPSQVRDASRNATSAMANTNIGGNNVVKVKQNTLSGTVTKDVDRVVYTANFRASKYNTLAAKIDAFGNNQAAFDITSSNLTVIAAGYNNAPETFDEYEIKGYKDLPPLLSFEAIPNQNWYNATIYPLLYEQYNNNGGAQIPGDSYPQFRFNGPQPLKAILLQSNINPNGYTLSESDIAASSALAKTGALYFQYNLNHVCFRDFFDLRNNVIRSYVDTPTAALPVGAQRLVNGSYPDLVRGDYAFKINYHLPGSNTPNNQKVVTIRYGGNN